MDVLDCFCEILARPSPPLVRRFSHDNLLILFLRAEITRNAHPYVNVEFLPVSNVIELPSFRPLFISGKKRTKRFVGTGPRLCFPIDQKSSHFGKFVEEQIEEGDVSHVHVRGSGFLVISAFTLQPENELQ